jgi:hypothetical protein
MIFKMALTREAPTQHKAAFQRSRNAAPAGWHDSPISLARMCMGVYDQIKGDDWTPASPGAKIAPPLGTAASSTS